MLKSMNSGPKLPLSFLRLPPDEDDPTIDAIAVDPRSSGHLHLSGTCSAESHPPAYRWKVAGTGNTGVEIESVQIGTSKEYVVRIDVHNHRDSPSFVRLYWV